MKAIVYHNYGSPDILEMVEIEEPAIKGDEVLVKVVAASVNWLDWHFLTGKPALARVMAGVLKPKNKVLGIDIAGRVEEVGADVKRFQAGDEVFGGCGTGGAFAEYAHAGEDELQLKPTNLTFEEAAAAGAAAFTALKGLRDNVQIEPGQRVLINGASGGVGTFAVQIAKYFGADVTGVCSTQNLGLVRSISADRVIDYTQEDFTQNEEKYDLIFDVVAKRSFSECEPALKPEGTYVTSEFSPFLALEGRGRSVMGNKKMVPIPPNPPSDADRAFMKELLESGDIRPVIDRCYPLSEVPEALRYLGLGHARGKVVITL